MNLGNVSLAAFPVEGDQCLQLISSGFLHAPLSRCPLPFLQGLELEWQTSPANLFLSHNVYLLPPRTPQPLFLTLPRTVNGESQPCPFHPSKAINGHGNQAAAHYWLAALEKSIQHTGGPSQLCHWGLLQKPRNTTNVPLKKGATLIRTWHRHQQSHQSLTIYMVGNHRKDLLFLKPPNWA